MAHRKVAWSLGNEVSGSWAMRTWPMPRSAGRGWCQSAAIVKAIARLNAKPTPVASSASRFSGAPQTHKPATIAATNQTGATARKRASSTSHRGGNAEAFRTSKAAMLMLSNMSSSHCSIRRKAGPAGCLVQVGSADAQRLGDGLHREPSLSHEFDSSRLVVLDPHQGLALPVGEVNGQHLAHPLH